MPTRTKVERRKAGLFPSRDVDVSTALELLDWSWYRFGRSTEKLAPPVIRSLLAALDPTTDPPARKGAKPAVTKRDADRRRAAAIFLHTAADPSDDDRLSETWGAAVEALKIFESQYAWGSKQKASRLAHVRADARLVEASRAAAVGARVVPLELLAVLAMDGTEASVDALMPHVERALKNTVDLEPLSQLLRFAAKTKPMKALGELIERSLAAARGTSPAMALATSLGIASGKRFRVDVRVSGNDGASFWVGLDSERPGPGFRGWVHETMHRGVAFVSDEGEAVCSLEALPKWLAAWAAERSVRWNFTDPATAHLRGARLETFLAWLRGG